MRELLRVLKPGASAVVVYANPDRLGGASQAARASRAEPASGPIYFFPHPLCVVEAVLGRGDGRDRAVAVAQRQRVATAHPRQRARCADVSRSSSGSREPSPRWRRGGLLSDDRPDQARADVARAGRPPLVSILTPSFNQGRFLRDCLDSVARQTYPRVEHIVVDGGSTDDSRQILAEAGDTVRWMSEPDQGQADAVNKAFEASTGEIVGWLNSDDGLFSVDTIEQVVGRFRPPSGRRRRLRRCGARRRSGRIVRHHRSRWPTARFPRLPARAARGVLPPLGGRAGRGRPAGRAAPVPRLRALASPARRGVASSTFRRWSRSIGTTRSARSGRPTTLHPGEHAARRGVRRRLRCAALPSRRRASADAGRAARGLELGAPRAGLPVASRRIGFRRLTAGRGARPGSANGRAAAVRSRGRRTSRGVLS